MNTSQEIDVAFEDMPRTAWATSPHRAKNKKTRQSVEIRSSGWKMETAR